MNLQQKHSAPHVLPRLRLALGLSTALLLAACGSDMDFDSGNGSLVNSNFAGNNVDYVAGMNGCLKLDQQAIADLYETTPDKTRVLDYMQENVGNVDSRTPPSCTIHVQMSDDKWDYLTGGLTLNREIKADEYMGDLHEATGGGENWQEAWELNQQLRGLESIPNMGLAALWNDKNRLLSIKFEGYTALVTAPGAAFNQVEQARERDYKAIAIEMAKRSGLVD